MIHNRLLFQLPIIIDEKLMVNIICRTIERLPIIYKLSGHTIHAYQRFSFVTRLLR